MRASESTRKPFDDAKDATREDLKGVMTEGGVGVIPRFLDGYVQKRAGVVWRLLGRFAEGPPLYLAVGFHSAVEGFRIDAKRRCRVQMIVESFAAVMRWSFRCLSQLCHELRRLSAQRIMLHLSFRAMYG